MKRATRSLLEELNDITVEIITNKEKRSKISEILTRYNDKYPPLYYQEDFNHNIKKIVRDIQLSTYEMLSMFLQNCIDTHVVQGTLFYIIDELKKRNINFVYKENISEKELNELNLEQSLKVQEMFDNKHNQHLQIINYQTILYYMQITRMTIIIVMVL